MSYCVQAITSEGDVAIDTKHMTQEEAYDFADSLVESWCNGWRPGGKVVVSDPDGEVRVTLLGDDPQEDGTDE